MSKFRLFPIWQKFRVRFLKIRFKSFTLWSKSGDAPEISIEDPWTWICFSTRNHYDPKKSEQSVLCCTLLWSLNRQLWSLDVRECFFLDFTPKWLLFFKKKWVTKSILSSNYLGAVFRWSTPEFTLSVKSRNWGVTLGCAKFFVLENKKNNEYCAKAAHFIRKKITVLEPLIFREWMVAISFQEKVVTQANRARPAPKANNPKQN